MSLYKSSDNIGILFLVVRNFALVSVGFIRESKIFY